MSFTAAYLTGHDQREQRPGRLRARVTRRAPAPPPGPRWANGPQQVADLVEGGCAHARRFADRLGSADGVDIASDVVLNQALVGFGDDDSARIVRDVQASGECWMGDQPGTAAPHAHLGVELADDHPGRRRVGGGDPGGGVRRQQGV